MSRHAAGTFTIDVWKAEPIDDRDGTTLTRTHVAKTFRGEIAGESTAELLMATVGETPTAYVGFERITARIHDRAGSFVLHHTATAVNGMPTASWTIVPGSGTGELEGLRGEAHIENTPDGGHTFALDYDLED